MGDAQLAEWARNHLDFFRPVDEGTTHHFAPLTAWASSRSYTAAAVTEFVGNTADHYLVAYAREHEHVLVAHERPRPNATVE